MTPSQQLTNALSVAHSNEEEINFNQSLVNLKKMDDKSVNENITQIMDNAYNTGLDHAIDIINMIKGKGWGNTDNALAYAIENIELLKKAKS